MKMYSGIFLYMVKLKFWLVLFFVSLSLMGCPLLIPIPEEGPEGEGEISIEGAEPEGIVEGEPEGKVEGEVEGEAPSDYISELEQEVYELINAERVAAGVPELFQDRHVAVVAREHSQDMADNDFFAHNNLEGDSPGDRLDNAGIAWMRYGENLAYNYGYSDPAIVAVEGWMASYGHRVNLLNPRYTHTGVGIAQDDKGAFYLTQDFVSY